VGGGSFFAQSADKLDYGFIIMSNRIERNVIQSARVLFDLDNDVDEFLVVDAVDSDVEGFVRVERHLGQRGDRRLLSRVP